MEIKLSDHFNYQKLIRFVLPSIGMMVFTSIYGVVDGFFVSNYAGATQFAAINLIMPFLMVFSAIGFMIGAGGTAYVSMRLGEGRTKEAQEAFSLLVYMVIVLGIIATVFGEILLRRVAISLGATPELLPYCVTYGRIIMASLVPFMLMNMFQNFLVTAEKPRLGLILTVASGVANMILDWLLVGVLRYSVTGAAYATLISQVIGGIIPLIYFLLPNTSLLHLGKAPFRAEVIVRSSVNGSSEFLTNVSISVVNMLYNKQLLRLAGEDGVSAYGVIMYVNFVFVSSFIGYTIGMAPIVGFNHGAGNHDELKNIFRKSLVITGVTAVAMTGLALILARPFSLLYVGYSPKLLEMAEQAFRIYSISFLLMGFSILGSAFFTALNNGLISGTISVLRTLVFQVIAVLLLPALFGLTGVWSAVVLAEFLSLIVVSIFFVTNRKRYGYA